MMSGSLIIDRASMFSPQKLRFGRIELGCGIRATGPTWPFSFDNLSEGIYAHICLKMRLIINLGATTAAGVEPEPEDC